MRGMDILNSILQTRPQYRPGGLRPKRPPIVIGGGGGGSSDDDEAGYYVNPRDELAVMRFMAQQEKDAWDQQMDEEKFIQGERTLQIQEQQAAVAIWEKQFNQEKFFVTKQIDMYHKADGNPALQENIQKNMAVWENNLKPRMKQMLVPYLETTILSQEQRKAVIFDQMNKPPPDAPPDVDPYTRAQAVFAKADFEAYRDQVVFGKQREVPKMINEQGRFYLRDTTGTVQELDNLDLFVKDKAAKYGLPEAEVRMAAIAENGIINIPTREKNIVKIGDVSYSVSRNWDIITDRPPADPQRQYTRTPVDTGGKKSSGATEPTPKDMGQFFEAFASGGTAMWRPGIFENPTMVAFDEAVGESPQVAEKYLQSRFKGWQFRVIPKDVFKSFKNSFAGEFVEGDNHVIIPAYGEMRVAQVGERQIQYIYNSKTNQVYDPVTLNFNGSLEDYMEKAMSKSVVETYDVQHDPATGDLIPKKKVSPTKSKTEIVKMPYAQKISRRPGIFNPNLQGYAGYGLLPILSYFAEENENETEKRPAGERAAEAVNFWINAGFPKG